MRSLTMIFFLTLAISACDSYPDPLGSDSTSLVHTRMVDSIKVFEHGKSIFISFCNACHYRPDSKKDVDPPLFDQLFRRMPEPSEDYFVKFLRDSKTLKDSGDPYANHLEAVWQQDYEHMFKDSLSNEDFKDLIFYFKIGEELRVR